MQGPEHVVSLYIATCGQNGPGLGSDEKEIILLVYVLLEVSTGQVSCSARSSDCRLEGESKAQAPPTERRHFVWGGDRLI